MSRRYELMRRLRAAVRAGDADEASAIATQLGFRSPTARKQLIERVWRDVMRKGAR